MKTRDRETLKDIYKIVDKKEELVFDLLFTINNIVNFFEDNFITDIIGTLCLVVKMILLPIIFAPFVILYRSFYYLKPLLEKCHLLIILEVYGVFFKTLSLCFKRLCIFVCYLFYYPLFPIIFIVCMTHLLWICCRDVLVNPRQGEKFLEFLKSKIDRDIIKQMYIIGFDYFYCDTAHWLSFWSFKNYMENNTLGIRLIVEPRSANYGWFTEYRHNKIDNKDTFNIINEIAEKCEDEDKKICPCCGNKSVIYLQNWGGVERCHICFWEKSKIQEDIPDHRTSPNYMSLNEARNIYKKHSKKKKLNIKKLYNEFSNKRDFLNEVWYLEDDFEEYRAKRMGYYDILKEREK